MKHLKHKINIFFSCLLALSLCAGCDKKSSPSTDEKKPKGSRDNTPVVLEPVWQEKKQIGNDKITFDLSNASEGYVMASYTGDNPKVKIRIQNPGSKDYYTYDVTKEYNVFPLTGGNGTYTFIAYENISGTKYSQLFSQSETLDIKNDYTTYLYPNQYVNFQRDSKAVSLSSEIVKSANNDLDAVKDVYEYVVNTLHYDDEKAEKAKNGELAGYLPDVDVILQEQKGICFDYAALMANMLRSQNIPAKMEIGYANMEEGAVYHAWLSVYIKDIGWIDDLIEFDGKNWSMMDPTLISDSNNSKKMRKFTKDKNNYTTKYVY